MPKVRHVHSQTSDDVGVTKALTAPLTFRSLHLCHSFDLSLPSVSAQTQNENCGALQDLVPVYLELHIIPNTGTDPEKPKKDVY